MPPSRRRPHPSAGQAPPVRRPRVAGLRNRPAPQETEPEGESTSGTLDAEDTEQGASATTDTEPDTGSATEPETEPEPETEFEADPAESETAAEAAPEAEYDDSDEDQLDADTNEPPPVRGRRPAGKRRTTGITRPADLSKAEAQTKVGPARDAPAERDPARRRITQLSVAAVLAVVAVVLAGLAIWFRGEADGLNSGDTNRALTDSGATSEAVGQLKSAIEQTFSYNYTDLDSTEKAVASTLTGKARCNYDHLFGEVKDQAPTQKIVMVTAVRDIALVRLDGDRAEALVFIDQSSTRVDKNNSVAGEAQFAVFAHREGEHWKITDFDMFDQPLVNGKPTPKC